MDSKMPFMMPDKYRQKQQRQTQRGSARLRKVEDNWNFYKKGLYITRPGRGLPAWLLPLSALLLIVALVFWGAPAAVNRIKQARAASGDPLDGPVTLLYGPPTRTVREPVADVFDRDDLKAGRLTQVLYNEPVLVLSEDCAYGFVQVRLADGLEGFMLRDDLADNRESIEPGYFQFKLVVTATSKRIMSHARKGTLLVEVMLGTVLFADYRGSGISRVRLPDGGSGWLSDDGVIILQPDAAVSRPATDAVRHFCNSAMAFNQITSLENGQSIRGISTVGIARLAGFVNGLQLPRSLAGLAQSGEPVPFQRDPVSGLADLNTMLPGDLIFLAAADDPDRPGSLAICTAPGMVLYARPGRSTVALLDLAQHPELCEKVILIRRLF